MARSIPQATTRPLGFALLRPTTQPQPDSIRILTMSGTIAVNLIALGLLMMPLAAPPPEPQVAPEPAMTARPITREPVVVEIVPVRNPQPVASPSTPERLRPLAPADSTIAASAVVNEAGTEPATESIHGENSGPAVESIEPTSMVPAPVQLEYDRAPAPKYPRNAQRLGLTGTVTLQILVGIDGRPLDVRVVRSSGHRELDEAARLQVLKRWSFRPATRDGIPIQAIGMVPVQFSLRR